MDESGSYEIEELTIKFPKTVQYWFPKCASYKNIDVYVTFKCEDTYNKGIAYY